VGSAVGLSGTFERKKFACDIKLYRQVAKIEVGSFALLALESFNTKQV
jgi:hypothetical protein